MLRTRAKTAAALAEHYQKIKAVRPQVRRSLQRQWRRSLAGLALLLALGQAPALAATVNVGGACSVVRAIVAANSDTTATGHCRKGFEPDVIVLPPDSAQTLTADADMGLVYRGIHVATVLS